MTICAYLVHWDEFVAQFKKRYAKDHTFLYRADEDQEPWLTRTSAFWTDSTTIAFVTSEAYDEVREQMKPADRKISDKLLGALFWHIPSRGCTPAWVHDLRLKADREVFCITMKPKTVKDYLHLASAKTIRSLRHGFQEFWNEATVDQKDYYAGRVDDADAFIRYASMWVNLLKEAARKKKGVVVSWHGT